MARYKHYLRKNVTSRRPSRLVFLDCDSASERLDSGSLRETFMSAALATMRRRTRGYVRSPQTQTITFISDVLDRIVEQSCNRARVLVISPRPVRVLTLLRHIEVLQARGWTLDTPVSSARFTAIAWRKDTRTLLFIAHSNLFPTHRLQNGGAAHRVNQMCDTWLEYLALLDDIDAGDFHLSIGAQALGIYRHRFIQHPILFHGDKRADELETRACFGALYQPLYAGRAPAGTYYYLDTNAMYPAMMKSHKYPWRLAGTAGSVPVSTLCYKMSLHDAIATVRVSTNKPIYPARIDGRTLFPVGEFVTTLTTPDLHTAAKRGDIQAVYALAWYDSADLFSAFVRSFWEMRRDFNSHGRPVWGSWAKAMMVSLYGRFGAHMFTTRSEGENPFDYDCADQMASLDSEEQRWYHTLAGKMWSSSRGGLHRESFPAIMAHVAAYGRNRMFQLIDLAGRKNVFVVLSDGLIVNQAGYENLQREIMPDELGMLKLKLSGDELEIRSDVEFRLSDHVWRPGIRADAIEIEDGVYVHHLDPNLASLARNGDTAEYVRRQCEIHLVRTIRSGVVSESGRIEPLRVGQPPLDRPRSPQPSVSSPSATPCISQSSP
jgi:hypothetical protein